MNLYRVIVRQTELLEYSVEAESPEEARMNMASGDEQIAQSINEAWKILEIKDRES